MGIPPWDITTNVAAAGEQSVGAALYPPAQYLLSTWWKRSYGAHLKLIGG